MKFTATYISVLFGIVLVLEISAGSAKQDCCLESKDEGKCDGNLKRYYYDKETDSCKSFTYTGCEGNGNNFYTLNLCEEQCIKGNQPSTVRRG